MARNIEQLPKPPKRYRPSRQRASENGVRRFETKADARDEDITRRLLIARYSREGVTAACPFDLDDLEKLASRIEAAESAASSLHMRKHRDRIGGQRLQRRAQPVALHLHPRLQPDQRQYRLPLRGRAGTDRLGTQPARRRLHPEPDDPGRQFGPDRRDAERSAHHRRDDPLPHVILHRRTAWNGRPPPFPEYHLDRVKTRGHGVARRSMVQRGRDR